MILTYRYRVLPTRRQHRALEAILESQRELYNAALQERNEAYRKANVNRTYFDQQKSLTEWRNCDPEAAAMPLNIQRATLRRVDLAYRAFFRRLQRGEKPGFPRFRGKGWFDSFGFREFSGVTLRGRHVRFKGLPGDLRVHFHRPMPPDAEIKCCTFRRDVKGWTVGFAIAVSTPATRPVESAVGVDLGITTFATLSDGNVIPSVRAARAAERRQRILQRGLARKKRGSHNREKARVQLRRCTRAAVRRRLNHLHQASAVLVRQYDIIAIEALRIGDLASGLLAKHVRDASWSKFISMLRYKAAKAGAQVIEVNPSNTTQDCSSCGAKVRKSLSDRRHDCPHCGLSIDRDLNAARNVLCRAGVGPGLLNVAGHGMRAGGNLSQAETLP